ncbi:MAG TPA: hypothetical protein VF108_10805 [Actinomycetota bacterium]
MKRIAAMVALGIGGFLAAIGLTVGALALAGDDTATVVHPQLTVSRQPSTSPSPDDDRRETPSPSAADHGGDPDDRGSDDHSGSGSDDSSGSGSDDSSGSGSDDSSGSGSDDSGSGSDDSGSGSDDSGSGSDDADDD